MRRTMEEFCETNKLRIVKCEYVDRNPNMDDFDGNHFKLVLGCGKRRMTVYFSQGYAHSGEPEIKGVLSCLASDSNGCDQDFESWCSDYGYDTDSRKAERIYNLCRKQAAKLKQLLDGYQNYEELLYNVDYD